MMHYTENHKHTLCGERLTEVSAYTINEGDVTCLSCLQVLEARRRVNSEVNE